MELPQGNLLLVFNAVCGNCRRLAEQEERTMPARLAAARARLAHQQEVEKERQERYKELVNTRDQLRESLVKPEAAG